MTKSVTREKEYYLKAIDKDGKRVNIYSNKFHRKPSKIFIYEIEEKTTQLKEIRLS